MSKKKILVAASSAISSQSWINRKLAETIVDASAIQVVSFGHNKILPEALRPIAAEVTVWPHGSVIRRSDIRNALGDVNYLLLLWDGRTLTDLLFEARLRNMPMKVHSIEVTEVVNKERTDEYDAYIGRGTPWGNPYHVGTQEGQFERDRSIDLYKEHFNKNIVNDPGKLRGLLGLRGMRIACHCKPLACHGDVIAGYLNSLDPDEIGE